MNKRKNILVTGGSGLVGSQILADVKLSSKDGDLRNWDVTNNIIQKYKYSPRYSCPDICKTNHIHFATDSLYQKRLNK